MNAFERAARAHSRAVDSVMGEALRFEPQRSVGRMVAGSADPSRPVRERFTGTVTARSGVTKRQGEGSEEADNARVVAERWTVSLSAELAAELKIQPGDVVVRLDRPNLPRLRLAEPLPIPGRAIFPAERV